MNLRKGSLLQLAALFAALPWTLARYQASLICEYGGIRTESSSSIVYACHNGCTRTLSYTPISFPTWTGHWLTELYGVDCSSGTAALCYNIGGRWYNSDTCPGTHEAVITIVNDTQRRRRLGESGHELEKFEEEVDIDGETWTVFGLREEQ